MALAALPKTTADNVAAVLSACGGRKCWTTCYCHHWSNSHFLHCPFCRKHQKTQKYNLANDGNSQFFCGFSEKGTGHSEQPQFLSQASGSSSTSSELSKALQQNLQAVACCCSLRNGRIAHQCLQNLWILILFGTSLGILKKHEKTLLRDSSIAF